MSDQSTIEWTDATWNPTRGCTKISPGCKHCHAETFAERFRGVPGHPYERGFDLRPVPESLDLPLHWRKPKRIFVNSMSDLFHEDVSDEFVVMVADVMARASWHTYQVLTKRSERLRDMLRGPLREFGKLGWIQWGVSVEDRKYGVPRIAHLQAAPAAVRILSVEPLLEELGEFSLEGIDWVIVGGESGPGCRPMDPAWARSVRDRCIAARVPLYFKQWGGYPKGKAGRGLDGRTWDEMP
jgi:protein gp37